MLFETEARLRKELARLQDDTKNIEDWPNPAGQWGMYIKAHIEYVEGRLARLQKRNMKQPLTYEETQSRQIRVLIIALIACLPFMVVSLAIPVSFAFSFTEKIKPAASETRTNPSADGKALPAVSD